MFNHHSKTKGGVTIATPGEIKGYWQAHKMYKKIFLPIEKLGIY
jgi:hypothetical protein